MQIDLLSKKGIQVSPVSMAELGTSQSLVHGTKNLMRYQYIQLDDQQQIMLLFPARHDLNAELITAHYGSQSFRKLSEDQVRPAFTIALCPSLPLHEQLLIADADYRSANQVEAQSLCEQFECEEFIFSGPKKYKARIKKVAPESARVTVFNQKSCFLGFSLESGSFEGNRLTAVLKWIEAKFEHCLILLADSIHVNTIRMDQGVSLPDAWEKSFQLASDAESLCQVELEKLTGCHFEIVKSSQYLDNPEYAKTLETLLGLYGENEQFKRSVDQFSKYFSERKNVERSRFMSLSKQYLLEELAITHCLIQQGYKVLVYPGELNAFDEIADGVHPGVSDELKQLTSISLAFRPAGQNSQ